MLGATKAESSFLHSLRKYDPKKPSHITHKRVYIDTIESETIENHYTNDDVVHHAKPAFTTATEASNQPYLNTRTKSIQEAKQAFLNSTITDANKKLPPLGKKDTKEKSPKTPLSKNSDIVTVTNKSEDSRITGGGIYNKGDNTSSTIDSSVDDSKNISKFIHKKIETHTRKVSFKTKSNTVTHRRSSITGKATVTVTNNKVAELTRKYNEMTVVANDKEKESILKQPNVVRSIEMFQNSSAKSVSNSSTPSSTLSAGTSIKIFVKNSRRRSIRGKNQRRRCSSVDSIDKIVLTDSPSPARKVLRTKSDSSRKVKVTKKKPQTLQRENDFPDTVDGVSSSVLNPGIVKKEDDRLNSSVKNAVKKLEHEMNTARPDSKENVNTSKGKPKIPEKKSSLIVTKNIVLKDGIPKIKVLKNNTPQEKLSIRVSAFEGETSETNPVKKDCLYGKTKHKSSLPKENLSLSIVEIVQENQVETVSEDKSNSSINVEGKQYEDITSRIVPNDSFLWRRKSVCFSSDADSSSEAHSYTTLIPIKTANETDNSLTDHGEETPNKSYLYELSESSSVNESRSNLGLSISNFKNNLDDLEINEALNKEILKKATLAVPEDDYEPFAVVDLNTSNETLTDRKSIERQFSKINCPLPEIPTENIRENEMNDIEINDDTENIYQCLLEMRSHPEGDESSMHSYEICNNELEERTRGDGDSDDGYEYCKSPNSGKQTVTKPLKESKPLPLPPTELTNYSISKSHSTASTVSYISSDSIYEKIPANHKPSKRLPQLPIGTRDSIASSVYTSYGENIYDTIKPPDGASISNCYESIPNSPTNLVRLRNNIRKQMSAVQKRLSFDSMSNVSRSTLSSEQKTNSIYGQRSMISFSGQEISFQVPNSDASVSDRSDRSEDWVDMSDQDEDKNGDSKIIIVRERSRKSPVSWSQKVRHQRLTAPKKAGVEADSSDSSHYYESLNAHEAKNHAHEAKNHAHEEKNHAHEAKNHAHEAKNHALYDDDFDSFDSDSDAETTQPSKPESAVEAVHGKLPSPPATHHTLTKLASAARRVAGKKMRELTRNLTARTADYTRSYTKSQKESKQKPKPFDSAEKRKPQESIYQNVPQPEKIYSPIIKTDPPAVRLNGNALNEELKEKINEKRLSFSNGDATPTADAPTTPTEGSKSKDGGTLSRKTYFSFKSRFRRASSMAVDINSEVPSALKITNSTFYLTDSMDGDSGFSNCSDTGNGTGSSETLQRRSPSREPGTRPRAPLHASSPDLAPPPRLERPTAPPPPPPTDLSAVHAELKRLLPSLSKKEKSPRTRTSWYAGADEHDLAPRTATSWYAEVGLYQEGSASSSSGASSSASPLPRSRFTAEPLYQFYNAAKVESVCRENVADSDSDGYETVREMRAAASQAERAGERPGAAWLALASRGPSRTLWCQLPEVIASNVLDTLTPTQKQLQEAKFEVVTSEASYLNSLSVLESHFICHPAFRDESVLSRQDRETLFGDIIPVRKCSQLLMTELERCWRGSLLLRGLCELVRAHALKHFHVYVTFCQNQVFLVKTLQRLKSSAPFAEALSSLEVHAACQSLSLHSFLMLPMQRVTRLPLLMDAVLRHIPSDDPEYAVCMDTLATLNNIVSQCNEGARNMERQDEMCRLAACIEFPAHMRAAPALAPRPGDKTARWLVRSGELTQLVWRGDEQLKLTFGKKFQKIPLWLFLFTDLLVITKKKSEECYVAVDYCQRSLLEVSCGDVLTQLNVKETPGRHVMLLTLLENHDNKTVEMLMSSGSAADVSRWREALSPPERGGGESVYGDWDCPQVAALYAYSPAQPDELALQEGDIVNVTRKMPEGWFYGERIRDGETGWFPGSYTAEVASPHVRARNLRQRYRLLALSASYLGQRHKI